MEKKLYELNIDPELKAFMPPLSETEQAALEANIIKNGCRVPLVVWDGTLVDGHHRYNICRRQNIPFAIEEQSFSDKGEAMLWMLQEQRSRRNQGLVARVVMALKCKPILLAKGKENQGHLMEDALYYFSGGMCTPENLSFILQTINGAHRNNLKMLQKAVKRAASDEIEGYTERNALADLLRACTGVGDDKIYAALDLLLSPDHQDE